VIGTADALSMLGGMRVRIAPDAASTLNELLEAVEVEALPVGESLELVHPNGCVGPHEDVELAFLVRAFETSRGAARGTLVQVLQPLP
jgi:hypothetical protein